METDCKIYVESKPDSHGRQRFTMTWNDKGGVFRPEKSNQDDQPVGYRRGQCFNAELSQYLRPDITVILSETTKAA